MNFAKMSPKSFPASRMSCEQLQTRGAFAPQDAEALQLASGRPTASHRLPRRLRARLGASGRTPAPRERCAFKGRWGRSERCARRGDGVRSGRCSVPEPRTWLGRAGADGHAPQPRTGHAPGPGGRGAAPRPGHGQLPAGRLRGGLDRRYSQCHRRPPSGHSQANLSLKPRVAAHGEQPAYQGPVHCIATIVRTDGLVGLYRGTSAMLLRDVPGYCLYFIPYVFLSEWITPEACASPSPCAAWLAGGMAGAISWGTATPMDVVKSRLQADGVHLNKYKGVLDCIYQSYQNEGLKGQSQQSKASVYWPQVAAEGSFSRCRCSESPGERRPPATPAVRLVGGALSPLAGPGIPSPPAARALLLSWPLGRRAGRTQRITIRFRSAPAPGETAPAPAHCKLAGRSRRGWGCLQSFQIKTSKTASAPFGIRCFRLDSRKHWPPSLFPLCRPLQLLLA
ncbi:solute carrier family 25 member 48 isoform X3 [Manis javanica]|uniref:solute carrier family 25 member 48 isoform X3 n=1 Tax=Manis javanica TaxID=9974 RepID=UPI003C6D7D4E